MLLPSFARYKELLLRYYKSHRRKTSYWLRLMRASLLIALVPLTLLIVYGIYGKLGIGDIFYGAAASFIVSMIIVRPYLTDLTNLTTYVENLALNKNARAPSLSFLSNFAKLSGAVDHLHKSWDEKRLQFEALIIESKILFDLLPDVFITLDDNLKILRTNSAAHNLFKRRMSQVRLEDVIPNPLLLSFVKWVMHDKKGKDLELYLPEPVNRHYIVRIEKFPIQSPGGISIILIMHDITESKHTEKMLADFVANASHEIRTPLTSLVGFIETLRTTAKDDDEAREQFLKIMAEQGDRMVRLVSDLLSLSKIEMNANTPPSEETAIIPLINGAVEHAEWVAKERGMSIEKHIQAPLPSIIADPHELTQLFTNLLSNAIKYGNADSIITVSAGMCDTDPPTSTLFKAGQKLIFIAVQDQGEGIAKEYLPRLTERFYRVNSARTQKNKVMGTGLGLSIVKHILKRHKGELVIESTLGVGSIFTVYLPVPELDLG